jgi:hypothetical protein
MPLVRLPEPFDDPGYGYGSREFVEERHVQQKCMGTYPGTELTVSFRLAFVSRENERTQKPACFIIWCGREDLNLHDLAATSS